MLYHLNLIKAFYALILFLLAGTTYGQAFPDNEARKAILELKGKMKNLELIIKERTPLTLNL